MQTQRNLKGVSLEACHGIRYSTRHFCFCHRPCKGAPLDAIRQLHAGRACHKPLPNGNMLLNLLLVHFFLPIDGKVISSTPLLLPVVGP